MRDKTAFGVTAALALTGVLALGSAPASAQDEEFIPDCETGVLSYPPGVGGGTVTVQDPLRGEEITASSGADTFDPGSSVEVLLFSEPPIDLGDVLADATGNASITFDVPDSVEDGPNAIRFGGTRDGVETFVGVCIDVEQPAVLGTTFNQPPAQPAALPFTGSVELLTVALAGAALVGVGTVSVVVTRRRRAHEPA